MFAREITDILGELERHELIAYNAATSYSTHFSCSDKLYSLYTI